jgi:Rap1a immunity proteins
MKRAFWLLGLSALSVCIPANESYAATETGNDLLKSCSTPSSDEYYGFERAKCLGYVLGAYDAFNTTSRVEGNIVILCPPEDLTKGQIRDIVVKYLEENPETRHESASDLVMLALSKAYPCKTYKSEK